MSEVQVRDTMVRDIIIKLSVPEARALQEHLTTTGDISELNELLVRQLGMALENAS